MKKFAAAACAAVSIMALGVVAAPSATAVGACQQQLDPDRRMVYKFKNGGTTLGYGQVVVQATTADAHRYCVKFQTGGRTVTAQWAQSDYQRVNGTWVYAGTLGSGPIRTSGFLDTMNVPDQMRVDRSFSIKHNEVWYSTIIVSRYNL